MGEVRSDPLQGQRKGRNIIGACPMHLHASVKKALRQAWDQDDANKAERLLRNLVRRLALSILEGLEKVGLIARPHQH